jgi:hypothetical protein
MAAGIAERRSEVPLDLFTPLIMKDAQVFRFCVRHARRFLQHPVGRHYVAGPDTSELRELCDELGCVFVPEEEVIGFGVDRLAPIWGGRNRSRAGWLLQQFLKLNCDTVTGSDNILVLDADTVFVSNVAFETNGRYLLQYNDGYMEDYDRATMNLLGAARLSSFSFVCHHMLLQRRLLRALRADLESRHGKPWYEAIIDHVPPGDFQPFSEYELYGNFAARQEPAGHFLEYWFNIAGQLDPEMDFEAYFERFRSTHRTVSLHYYARKRS